MASKSITIEGTIHRIGEIKTRGAKGFQSRELVVLVEDGKYPQMIPVELHGEKVSGDVDGYRIGDAVSIDCNVRGREWTSPAGEVRTFLTLAVWKFNSAAPSANRSNSSAPAPAADFGGYGGTPRGMDDDIPF